MPSSKLAFFRYLLIDRMLRSKIKKFPTKMELLDECHDKFGVRSISTIEKDLNAMRLEFDAPIEYHKRLKGYYYSDASFKLLSVNLSDEHLVALQFVETFLEEFKFLPIFTEFSDAVDKVLDGLEITRNFQTSLKDVGNYIQIDKSQYVKGNDVLSQLIKVITEGRVIQIEYLKFGAEQSKTYTVHTYLLKEFKDLWYLIGYVEEYDAVRTFGVDRIQNFEKVTEVEFKEQEEVNFDANRFFEFCYGITALNGQPERIILQFTPQQGNYIKTNPIHHTQTVLEDNEEEFRIELQLVNNFELRSWILGFGSSVKVLEPDSLATLIKEEIKNTLENY